ncbi:PQQ-dependent sugar dehydrogenase [Legionella jamestowniensis]|uniref:Glucose sorbosone dehydrogenase n=1 Tax=Legionella jamestowniensis TaxID=455 RepID=A0A0W0UHI4_9GAMM|nr:PQQ-dependent sugar dehydrogenase [Legionella jamestowniensis]KTD07017.1 Soluble aldose sugar dehydrogenase YliI precursor [Legionella jamestowniensis]OCH96752.1 glucose sorbosone dehydrogenase [Legionella jamestowniensis]SFM03707.1 Glucose/arabinose dehydrogenase, beta-propeller fold [Legionella jamestowniensis DSM 19215]
MNKVKLGLLLLLIVIILALAFAWWEFLGKRINVLPKAKSSSVNPILQVNQPLISVVSTHLEIPWAIDFLPNQQLLISERAGIVSFIDLKENNQNKRELLRINEVTPIGEGGLLGLAVHPDFKTNHYVYLYYTYQANGQYFNRVVRYQLNNNTLNHATVILDKIPGASTHDGGRIRFGPDGYLYITTGDAQQPQNAQKLNSLAGKILRLKDDGSIPKDNPFNNSPVFSYGHRNPQGIAWDESGQLWATEHGPSAHDEINLIKAGKNYGWPLVKGKETKTNIETPILESGSATWAPSGADIFQGTLFFAGLRGRTLYGFNLKTRTLKKYFQGELGRLREIKIGPDKLFYIATNNRDGRGVPKADDDLIVVVNPEKL